MCHTWGNGCEAHTTICTLSSDEGVVTMSSDAPSYAVMGCDEYNPCREFDNLNQLERGQWNMDEDCCAGVANAACADGYTYASGDVLPIDVQKNIPQIGRAHV